MTELKNFWTVLFPEVPAPADRQFSLWLALHDPATVKTGIAQLAAKHSKVGGQMENDYMIRFASSVMNRLERTK